MAKLRLSINSTDVLGVYGIVNVVFNGTTLASSKQLSATVENLEYNIAGIDNTSNTLKISLLNDQAHDVDLNGIFTDPGDQTLQAVVSALSYSNDGKSWTGLGYTYFQGTGKGCNGLFFNGLLYVGCGSVGSDNNSIIFIYRYTYKKTLFGL